MATAATYSSDDRQALALIFLPILLMAFAVGMTQSMKLANRWREVGAAPPTAIASHRGVPTVAPAVMALQRAHPAPMVLVPATTEHPASALPAPLSRDLSAVQTPTSVLVAVPPMTIAATAEAPLAAATGASLRAAPLTTTIAPVETALQLALLAPAQPILPATRVPSPADIPLRHGSLDGIPLDLPAGTDICTAPGRLEPNWARTKAAPASLLPPQSPVGFGLALAAAARTQLDDLVIYNDRYRSMRYPLGDVNPLFGVCTDVIVRAYRALGIDLQALVHETRAGAGDPNIDHRRTETLRRFFARFGQSLAVTGFAEDYTPGDIVTYNRPQNRHSRSHIAIVSDVVAPSGRFMILHNRGWGPQLEDGLFVDEITGHYRFSGIAPAASRPVAGVTAATQPALRAARLVKASYRR